MTAEHAGIIGMIRAYVLAILIAPVVGLLADKVGSAIKVMNWLFIAGVIGVAMFLGDPTGSDYGMGPDRHPDDCRLH
ncbi:putative membrane protein [Salmonella enterica subsp. enterica]|nr:putative membrane protein [Salmonella enterica subsp. enterica]